MKKPFYAQDFTKGQIFKLGKKTITKDEIIDFAIIDLILCSLRFTLLIIK